MTEPNRPFLRLIPHRDDLELPLGRHQEHDPRSRDFPFAAAPLAGTQTVLWPDSAPILNQAKLGGCVGFTGADLLNTDAYAAVRAKFHPGFYGNADGQQFYHLATIADSIPGQWPPTDTGSSGLGLAKALKKLGLIKGYTHAFGFAHFLNAIAFGPVAVGTLWTNDMFKPDKDGLVHVGDLSDSNVAGGHEYMVRGWNAETKRVRARNHWTPQWGDAGEFEIGQDDFAELLHNGGDVTILHS